MERTWQALQEAGRRRAPPREPGLRLQLAEAYAVGAGLVTYAEKHDGRLPLTLSELQPAYLGTSINTSNYTLLRPGQVYPPDARGFGPLARDVRGYWKGDRRADVIIYGTGSVHLVGD